MRILGVDPGLRITGYGCVEGMWPRPALLEAGVFRLDRRRTGVGGVRSVSERLGELDRDFREVLERLSPDVVAVESLFSHYAHPSTAIVMGHARGVLLLAIQRAGAELVEYRPSVVKNAIAGHGGASKHQVQRAVQSAYGLERVPEPSDLADALAIAWCAAQRLGLGLDGADVGRARTQDPGAGAARRGSP